MKRDRTQAMMPANSQETPSVTSSKSAPAEPPEPCQEDWLILDCSRQGPVYKRWDLESQRPSPEKEESNSEDSG